MISADEYLFAEQISDEAKRRYYLHQDWLRQFAGSEEARPRYRPNRLSYADHLDDDARPKGPADVIDLAEYRRRYAVW